MKPVAKATRRGRAFTIVELLTVMSIIVILIGLLVPALNKVKQYATNVRQRAQFHSIEAALELFDSQFGGYPDSSWVNDATAGDYCGALKLCEAMMGQDLMGYHPDSVFRSDGRASRLLATGTPVWVDLYTPATISSRVGPFLPLENANAYRLRDIYGTDSAKTTPFNPERFVLCDVFNRVTNTESGKKIGMPVLYYKANTSKQAHDLTNPNNPDNIYNWVDNSKLLELGMPWDTAATRRIHRLLSYNGTPSEPPGQRFYWNIRNEKVSVPRPYRADSYILISAGWDGEYGTADDICNFDWSFRDQLQ